MARGGKLKANKKAPAGSFIIMTKNNFTVETLKTRLDKFLAESMPEVSRSQLQRDIEAGAVKVNGEVVESPKFVVRLDDKIVYKKLPEVVRPKKSVALKTLYNNHGLLIIDKPAGLSVHAGAGVKGDSLADILLYTFKEIRLVGEEGRSGIVHRLDKDTSGVILIALTQNMYEYLKDAFAERKVKKDYIALVSGRMPHMHGHIDIPIGKSKTDFRKYTTKNMLLAKPSLTEYWVLEYLDGYTLIRVRLHTGRTHQIRVHFLSQGFPLAGDSLYGSKSALKQASSIGLDRQFLHALRIEVQLPDGTWIETESPLPDDLRKVLKNLGSKKVNSL
jgi:23S rRNA pseudouridine1911/1915/1917 synthase